MVRLPFRPTPFFENKNAAFWNLQFLGWGGVLVLRAMSALANEQPWDLLLVVLVQIITGFAISLILSVIYGHLIKRNAFVTWTMTALVLALAVALYAAIDAWLQGIYYSGTRDTTFAQRILALAFLDGTLLGAWSALY
jgi:two-component system, LytTR family, sensor kinase